MCDFSGFQQPEMIKKRPVIILNARMIGANPNLVTVVPLSTKTPSPACKWHYRLDAKYLPNHKFFKTDNWVKADMIYNISIDRLELIQLKRVEGKRQYYTHRISQETFDEIMKCVLYGLGLSEL